MKSWKRVASALAIASLGVAAFSTKAEALSTSAPFTVSATVVGTCTMTTSNLVFPGYVSGGTEVFASAPFSVSCPGAGVGAPPVTVPVQFGFATASGAFQMTGPGGATLNYDICEDGACTYPYAPGVQGPYFVGVDATPFNHDTWGRIIGGQAVPTGAYAQTVTATLYF